MTTVADFGEPGSQGCHYGGQWNGWQGWAEPLFVLQQGRQCACQYLLFSSILITAITHAHFHHFSAQS